MQSIFLLLISLTINGAQGERLLGRVNPETRELSWPGTGVAFSFTGSSATINLQRVSGSNSVELTVDGIATVIPSVSGASISTPPGLSNGTHKVVLRKRSEALFGSIFLGNITTVGTFEKDDEVTRKIEFIGDSITVGYGLDGVNPCQNNASVENNPKTYGALTAGALKADYAMIAWSGIGLTRNYPSNSPDPSPIMPVRWTRYNPNDANNSYPFPAAAIPNVVVINLGTNDFSYVGMRDPLNVDIYIAAMVQFIKDIKVHYPTATFFLVASPMIGDDYPAGDKTKTVQKKALGTVVKQLNGTDVHLVDWPTQGSDVGCDYHPSAAAHKLGASVVSAAIAEKLGW
ncbi:carbohydrate esterase family 2 protein [Periconia macrospinosa]|uniref:Carbohydrate esterase family 2 protein n=1 Tax=Periconia macrospinosa TaxID=97972 RepID=A0A2V1D1T3_9PLEO|nr:carbohydrate esterase family 2 protein [Periconia macrospinosa]